MFNIGRTLLAAGKTLASFVQKKGVQGEAQALNSTSSFVRPQLWREIEAANKKQRAEEEQAAAAEIAVQEQAALLEAEVMAADAAQQVAEQMEADHVAAEAALAAQEAADAHAAWVARRQLGKRLEKLNLALKNPLQQGLDTMELEERGWI